MNNLPCFRFSTCRDIREGDIWRDAKSRRFRVIMIVGSFLTGSRIRHTFVAQPVI